MKLNPPGPISARFPSLRGDLTDCLMGDTRRDYRPLFEAVAEFATLPGPLAHGLPEEKSAADAVTGSDGE